MPRVDLSRPVGFKTRPEACIECGRSTRRRHPILNVPLHQSCQRDNGAKYGFITKSRAQDEYRLKKEDLARLSWLEVPNPHFKIAAPMQLYLKAQVLDIAQEKWKTTEPYIVTIKEFSEDMIARLGNDPQKLLQLSPGRFQDLIANRLETMGLDIQIVGNVFQKDGGIDIVAYPKVRSSSFPFLIGVQVKHHRVPTKTGSSEVRNFHGVLTSLQSPFHIGMIVTNTAFTADARWFAENNSILLRLRDLADLRRWLRNDFVNEAEWREIPDEIQLAPGIRIFIPKPKVVD